MAAKRQPSSDSLHAGMPVEDAQALVSQHFEWLTRSENIHSLAVDWKTVQGKVTDHPALVFYVSKKKPVERLTPKEKIPRQVQDDARKCMIDTDVVEMKSFTSQKAAGRSLISTEYDLVKRYATLGVNIIYVSQLRLLTAAHTVEYDESAIGTTIYQSTAAGDTALFPISGMFPVKKYDRPNPPNPIPAQKDVLWANVTDDSKISTKIVPPGKVPAGIREGVKGDVFTLSGATTGFHDDVKVNNASVATRIREESPDGNDFYTFWEKLMEYSISTKGGDSGAALLSKNDNMVIGLHRAGNREGSGLASQLYPVADIP